VPETKLYQINFAQGLDQRTSPKYVQQGKLLTATNAVFEKTGSIAKRPGNIQQSTAILTPGGAAAGLSLLGPSTLPTNNGTVGSASMGSYGGQEVLLSAGGQLYSQSSPSNAWIEKDYVSECVAITRRIDSSALMLPQKNGVVAVASSNGVSTVVHAWESNGSIYSDAYEFATGNQLIAPEIAAGAPIGVGVANYRPRLVAIGSVVVVLCADTTGKIYANVLDVSVAFQWGTTQTLASNGAGGANPVFDAFELGSGGQFILAYALAAGGVRLVTYQVLSGTVTQVNAATVGTDTTIKSIGVWGNLSPDNFGVVFWSLVSGGTNSQGKAYGFAPSNLAQTFAAVTVFNNANTTTYAYAASVGRLSSTQVALVWNDALPFGAFQSPLRYQTITNAGALGTKHSWYGLTLASRPFVVQTNGPGNPNYLYALVYNPSSTQGTQYIVHLNGTFGNALNTVQMRAVATLAPRVSNSNAQVRDPSTLSNFAAVQGVPGHGWYLFSGTTLAFSGLVGIQNVCEIRADFGLANRGKLFDFEREVSIGGGVPQLYDGRGVHEHGFQMYPEGATAASPGAGGGLGTIGSGSLSAGTYQYVFVYEWLDAKGQVKRSAGSKPISVVVGGGSSVTLSSVPYLPLVSRYEGGVLVGPFGVVVVPYRTLANGTVFYRLVTGTINGAILQNVEYDSAGAGSFSFVDASSDASISGNPFLYTTGGYLDNVCPPSFLDHVVHKRRVYGIGDDLRTIWASKEVTEGEVPGFNEALTLTVDDAGDLTAITSIDDKLVVFKADATYIIQGDGPNDAGAGSDWSQPQKLAPPIGCIAPNSIVAVDDGVMFRSRRGVELLTRDLQIVWVGAAVQDAVSAAPFTLQASYFSARQEARFSLPTGPSTGIIACWNVFQKQWTTFQLYDNVAALSSAQVVAQAVVGGTLWWVSVAGTLFQEDNAQTTWMDGGSAAANWVQRVVETGWMYFGEVSAYERARFVSLIGKWYSSCDLKIEIGTNFQDTYNFPSGQTHTWASTVLDNLDPFELNEQVVNQISHGIKVRITDLFPTGGAPGSGRGVSLDALLAEIATIPGAPGRRLAAAQRG
jgi:hypothetical protein